MKHLPEDTCRECDGVGKVKGLCSECGGNGISQGRECDVCEGLCEIFEPCEACNGLGTYTAYCEEVEVSIQKALLKKRYGKEIPIQIQDYWTG